MSSLVPTSSEIFQPKIRLGDLMTRGLSEHKDDQPPRRSTETAPTEVLSTTRPPPPAST